MIEVKMKNKLIRRLIVGLGIISLILLIFIPSLSVEISFNTAGNGSLQVYYYNSNHPDLELMEYDTHTAWKNIQIADNKITFDEIPIVTDTVRLDIDGTQSIEISEINISFAGFLIKQYTGDKLIHSISKVVNLEIIPGTSSTEFYVLAPGAYLMLNSEQYVSIYLWIFIYGIIIVVSYIFTLLLERFTKIYDNIDLRELLLWICPFLMFYFAELISENYWFISIWYRLLNSMILIFFYRIIYIILFQSSISILLCNLIVAFISIANSYVLAFRGKPIVPWDLTAISTAAEVMNSYTFKITAAMFMCIISGLILFLITTQTSKKKTKHKFFLYIPHFFIIIILTIFFSQKNNLNLWDNDLIYYYKIQGDILSFSNLLHNNISATPQVPKGYDNNSLYPEDVQVTDVTLNVTQPENIIMIMNESFSDLKCLGTDYGVDVIPTFNNLDNTIKGNLYVSVRGGGTCNTEFESLTGNTMAFLPTGSYPFQTYIKSETSSLAQYFSHKGYRSIAMHLEKPSNWNRKNVYPLLGFDDFYSIGDFDHIELVRNRATDQYNFDQLIKLCEEQSNEKKFIFNVTIQNHGGYDEFQDLEKWVDLKSYGDYQNAEVFLSLIKESDLAFNNLVNYFSAIKTPTLIIMYGDHQPNLGDNVDNWLSSTETAGNSALSNLNKYVTPFIIWANYDIPDMYIDKMSANYLPSLILKIGNFELPPYNEFLLNLYEHYPVITAQGIIDDSGEYYRSYTDISDLQFLKYQYLQYNNLFDKNRKTELFE